MGGYQANIMVPFCAHVTLNNDFKLKKLTNICSSWTHVSYSYIALANIFLCTVIYSITSVIYFNHKIGTRSIISFMTHSLYDGACHSFKKKTTLFHIYAIATGLVFRKNQE
jgi:hypothetical protein